MTVTVDRRAAPVPATYPSFSFTGAGGAGPVVPGTYPSFSLNCNIFHYFFISKKALDLMSPLDLRNR